MSSVSVSADSVSSDGGFDTISLPPLTAGEDSSLSELLRLRFLLSSVSASFFRLPFPASFGDAGAGKLNSSSTGCCSAFIAPPLFPEMDK
jgi:hypothetical protein